MKIVLEKLKGLGFCLLLLIGSQLGLTMMLLQIEAGIGFSILQTALVAVIMLGLCWAALVYAHWKGWIVFPLNWWTTKYVKYLLLSYPMIFGFSLLGSLIMQLQGTTEMVNEASLDELFQQIPFVLTALLTVVSAPIFEEILCRGAIPDLLFPKYPRLGLVMGSLFFAWLHSPTHLGAWVIYGGMGLVFAWLRYRTGRLEMAILGHMLWNSFALLMTFAVT